MAEVGQKTLRLTQVNKHKSITWSYKINVYTSTKIIIKQLGVDKFCKFDRELQNITPSCFIITEKYMAPRSNKLKK